MAAEREPSPQDSQGGSNGAENNTNSQVDPLKDVLLRAGHTQVAAMTAASRLLFGLAQSADNYAQALGTEMCDLLEGRAPSDEAASRFADVASTYLRELTELPEAAAKHFKDQIAKEPRNQGPRKRRARVKE